MFAVQQISSIAKWLGSTNKKQKYRRRLVLATHYLSIIHHVSYKVDNPEMK